MVHHVQHGGFAEGVASLELAATSLGWSAGTEGVWLLFDIRVVRQEGLTGGPRVLRNELASYLVQRGSGPVEKDDIVEMLHEALDGPLKVDSAEARRAYTVARAAAEIRLAAMYDQVVTEFGTKEAILPQPILDVALAWVRAS
jgi:hypothetical protein